MLKNNINFIFLFFTGDIELSYFNDYNIHVEVVSVKNDFLGRLLKLIGKIIIFSGVLIAILFFFARKITDWFEAFQESDILMAISSFGNTFGGLLEIYVLISSLILALGFMITGTIICLLADIEYNTREYEEE